MLPTEVTFWNSPAEARLAVRELCIPVCGMFCEGVYELVFR